MNVLDLERKMANIKKPNTFLAIGGPLNRQMISWKEAYEWKYTQFNRSGRTLGVPTIIFVWQGEWV